MQAQSDFKKRFSFEFFPAKTEKGEEKLKGVHAELCTYNPDFFSVSYGAGGSTRDRTLNTILDLSKANKIPVAPHLSCIGDSKEQLAELLQLYRNNGVKRIVALRGDLPSGMGASSGEFHYANELVEFIKAEHSDHFHLEVAAYPEPHPQSPNMEADLLNFKRKVDAGADSAITQYFYNADAYFYFVERCEKMGINIPIVAGIMPITNYTNLVRFSDACGAEIPRWIRRQLEAYGDDIDSIKKFGEEVVTNMCQQLLDGGAPGFHFYTMNQAAPNLAIWNNLKLSDIK